MDRNPHEQFQLTSGGRVLDEDALSLRYPAVHTFLLRWKSPDRFLDLRTSGSTGPPSVHRVSKNHMWHSAGATLAAMNLKPGNRALLALSADYIAGMMMLVRAMRGGLSVEITEPSGRPLDQVDGAYHFAALVPLQVAAQLDQLYRVEHVIVGGAPVSQALFEALRPMPVAIYATYGMTETVSHIALRRISGPEASDVFQALDGVTFSLSEQNTLLIHAQEWGHDALPTNDVVDLIDSTHFVWKGRTDFVINSGGIKVHPEEVESALNRVIKTDIYVTGLPHERLGEEVVAIALRSAGLSEASFLKLAGKTLDTYRSPRKLIEVETFPLTDSQKIDRPALRRLCLRIAGLE